LIDTGVPKLYALDLSDLPDANTTDPTDLPGNCGRIGIEVEVERSDNLRALFGGTRLLQPRAAIPAVSSMPAFWTIFQTKPTLTPPISLATAVALELTLSAAMTCRCFLSVSFFPGMAA
jgi:hypothetical protein